MPGQSDEHRVRLFVAFDLPDRLVAGLSAWQAKALKGTDWRPVTAETLHLTLAFLGSRPEGEIEAVGAVVAGELPSSPPSLQLLPTAVGIPRRSPLAVAFEAGDATGVGELAQRLGSALERAGLHKREPRPFWPHLTVARRRKRQAGAAGRGRPPRAPVPSEALAPEMTEAFALDRLVVYRSETRPEGSRHHAEATFSVT